MQHWFGGVIGRNHDVSVQFWKQEMLGVSRPRPRSRGFRLRFNLGLNNIGMLGLVYHRRFCVEWNAKPLHVIAVSCLEPRSQTGLDISLSVVVSGVWTQSQSLSQSWSRDQTSRLSLKTRMLVSSSICRLKFRSRGRTTGAAGVSVG